MAQNLYRVKVIADSLLVNKMLQNLSITERFSVSILEIRRDLQRRFHKTVNQDMAGPGSTIRINDILYVLGEFTHVDKFVRENRLSLVDTHQTEARAMFVSEAGGLDFSEIGIAEVVLLSNSKVGIKVLDKGRILSESEFTEFMDFL